MRMRRKPWARPELAACPFFVEEPTARRDKWRGSFAKDQPLHVELGCGKGGFAAKMGAQHPELNLLAVDIKSEVLAVARRTIVALYGDRPVENIQLTSHDIERIDQILGPGDVADRIYINFCNPWPKSRDHKKRLTHSRWLEKYKAFLRPGGEIWFKTDDDNLFLASLRYFGESGFQVTYQTRDLHQSGFGESVPTEHEAMFTQLGLTTKFLIARWPGPQAKSPEP